MPKSSAHSASHSVGPVLDQMNNLPQPPSLWQSLGPSFILLGLALGSGELLLWPYLGAVYGLGLLWGAVLGISFQFVLNTETMRYTLAWGESVFVGFRRLSRWLPLWFIISTVIPWSLPGFSSATAQILHSLWPSLSQTGVAIGLLLLTGLILSAGKSLYSTLEKFQRTIILIGLPFLFILTLIISSRADWLAAGQGLLGVGESWRFFPPGISIAAFLGAFAYAGAGGNLNLAQSYYVKEKGFGMGKYLAKISSLFSKKQTSVEIEGQTFPDDKKNRLLWKQWVRLVNQEHLIIFWGLGLLTIVILSVLAYSTVYGQPVEEGLGFLFSQAEVIATETSQLVGVFFLLIAASMLFATQVGVLESSSRIISENILLFMHQPGEKHRIGYWFYIALWTQIGAGIIIYLLGFQEPKQLITTAALLNAAAMMVAFILVPILNQKQLNKRYRAGKIRAITMFLATLFFFYFLTLLMLK